MPVVVVVVCESPVIRDPPLAHAPRAHGTADAGVSIRLTDGANVDFAQKAFEGHGVSLRPGLSAFRWMD
jgi:hypothetical protein